MTGDPPKQGPIRIGDIIRTSAGGYEFVLLGPDRGMTTCSWAGGHTTPEFPIHSRHYPEDEPIVDHVADRIARAMSALCWVVPGSHVEQVLAMCPGCQREIDVTGSGTNPTCPLCGTCCRADTWAVICRADRLPTGAPGAYELATRQIFATSREAAAYADSISTSRESVIVSGDWRAARARAARAKSHLYSSRVPVEIHTTSPRVGRLLPLDTTRVLHAVNVRGRCSQLRLPGDGALPAEPTPSLDVDPNFWSI